MLVEGIRRWREQKMAPWKKYGRERTDEEIEEDVDRLFGMHCKILPYATTLYLDFATMHSICRMAGILNNKLDRKQLRELYAKAVDGQHGGARGSKLRSNSSKSARLQSSLSRRSSRQRSMKQGSQESRSRFEEAVLSTVASMREASGLGGEGMGAEEGSIWRDAITMALEQHTREGSPMKHLMPALRVAGDSDMPNPGPLTAPAATSIPNKAKAPWNLLGESSDDKSGSAAAAPAPDPGLESSSTEATAAAATQAPGRGGAAEGAEEQDAEEKAAACMSEKSAGAAEPARERIVPPGRSLSLPVDLERALGWQASQSQSSGAETSSTSAMHSGSTVQLSQQASSALPDRPLSAEASLSSGRSKPQRAALPELGNKLQSEEERSAGAVLAGSIAADGKGTGEADEQQAGGQLEEGQGSRADTPEESSVDGSSSNADSEPQPQPQPEHGAAAAAGDGRPGAAAAVGGATQVAGGGVLETGKEDSRGRSLVGFAAGSEERASRPAKAGSGAAGQDGGNGRAMSRSMSRQSLRRHKSNAQEASLEAACRQPLLREDLGRLLRLLGEFRYLQAAGTAGGAYRKLVEKHITPLNEKRTGRLDTTFEPLAAPEVMELISRWDGALKEVFKVYCKLDHTMGFANDELPWEVVAAGDSTLSLYEWMQMCRDKKLTPGLLSQREAEDLFRRSNLTDVSLASSGAASLPAADGERGTELIAEMNFPEFTDAICMAALVAFSRRQYHQKLPTTLAKIQHMFEHMRLQLPRPKRKARAKEEKDPYAEWWKMKFELKARDTTWYWGSSMARPPSLLHEHPAPPPNMPLEVQALLESAFVAHHRACFDESLALYARAKSALLQHLQQQAAEEAKVNAVAAPSDDPDWQPESPLEADLSSEQKLYFALANGSVLRTAGRDTEALRGFHAVEQEVRKLPAGHELVGDVHNAIGCLLYYQGEHQESYERFLRAMIAREKSASLGKEHPRTAVVYCNMACTLSMLGKGRKALNTMQQAYAVMKSKLGVWHAYTDLVRRNVAVIQHDMVSVVKEYVEEREGGKKKKELVLPKYMLWDAKAREAHERKMKELNKKEENAKKRWSKNGLLARLEKVMGRRTEVPLVADLQDMAAASAKGWDGVGRRGSALSKALNLSRRGGRTTEAARAARPVRRKLQSLTVRRLQEKERMEQQRAQYTGGSLLRLPKDIVSTYAQVHKHVEAVLHRAHAEPDAALAPHNTSPTLKAVSTAGNFACSAKDTAAAANSRGGAAAPPREGRQPSPHAAAASAEGASAALEPPRMQLDGEPAAPLPPARLRHVRDAMLRNVPSVPPMVKKPKRSSLPSLKGRKGQEEAQPTIVQRDGMFSLFKQLLEPLNQPAAS